MKAIYKRELQSYFHSFLGALFIGATLLLIGIYFSVYDLFMGYPYIGYAISSVTFLFLVTIPILSMKILAEERHQKTDQLILTSPVSVGGIVTGKFLALATIFAIPTAIVSIYPIILSFFGTVDFGKSYLSILGFFLYGLASIAICVFVSALTESQVIAAVLSFGLLFLGYIMAGLCNIISSSGNLLTEILSVFDMVGRFDDLLNGSLHVSSIVYYLSVIVLFLIFTVQVIQKRRYQLSKKTLSLGTYSTTVIIVITAAMVLLNVFVAEIPSKYTVFDVTADQLYSLSDETKTLVSGLDEDVNLYVLVNESSADSTLDETLKNYEGLSSHIKVSYVDPAVNPKFYTNYTDSSISSNSVIVESSKRSKVVNYSDIYEYEYDYYSYSSTVTGYDGEGQITSAIAYVTGDDMPKIYMTEGHGEMELDSSFTTAIEKENVDYETINLMDYEEIPEDASCVIIIGPTADFSEDDRDKMLAYMEQGGDVFLVSTYTGEELEHFNELLAFYGVSVTNGLVIEADKGNYYSDPFYLLPNISYDTITSGVYNNGSYIFAPYAQGLTWSETEDVDVSTLLSTSDKSYAREDVANSQTYDKQDNDTDGPFDIGLKCEKTTGEETSVAVIYSCKNLFTSSADNMVAGNNMKLFTASLGSFVSHESSVSIPVKNLDTEYLTVPQSTILILAFITTILLPFAFIIAGFVIWFKRRKK
jgi:ABC-2 type transport system permease protein